MPIKPLQIDTSGRVPCPDAENLTLSKLINVPISRGTSIAGLFPELVLRLKDGDDSPRGLVDYFRAGLLHVVSSKLRLAFESINAELEYFPVTVLYNGQQLHSFYVANPLRRLKAVDLEKSEVDIDEELGDAISVHRLILDETKLEGVKLAIIDEILLVGVSEEVASAIVRSDCTGFVLADPSTIRY